MIVTRVNERNQIEIENENHANCIEYANVVVVVVLGCLYCLLNYCYSYYCIEIRKHTNLEFILQLQALFTSVLFMPRGIRNS